MPSGSGIGAFSGLHVVGRTENGRMRAEKGYRFATGVRRKYGHPVQSCRDACFGLIETAEQVVRICMRTVHLPRRDAVRDNRLREPVKFPGVNQWKTS